MREVSFVSDSVVRHGPLLDALPVGVVLVDRDMRIAHWNLTLVEWTGVFPQEMVGRELHTALPGIEMLRYRLRIESALAGGPPATFQPLLHQPLLRLAHDHSANASIRMTVSGWRDPRSGAAMALLVFENMTELNALAHDYRDARDRAQREIGQHQRDNADLRQSVDHLAATNEELEQFAFMASHDLREPLHKIRMFADLLAEDARELLPAEGIDMVQRIGRAAERLEQLLGESLALLRAGASVDTQQVVQLEDVVHDALDDLESRVTEADANVVIGTLPAVLGDPVSIHHLLLNLLSNALKFRHPDRRCELRIRAAQGSLLSSTGEMLAVRLSVSDNGIGFDPRHASEIFKPFRRLHGRGGSYGGHGLGLAICRRIVRSHQGQIWAESELNSGTTMHVMLPAVPAPKPDLNAPADLDALMASVRV